MKKHLPKIIILTTIFTSQSIFSAAAAAPRSKLSANAAAFVPQEPAAFPKPPVVALKKSLLSAGAAPFISKPELVFVPLDLLPADQKTKFIEGNLPLLNVNLSTAERLAAGHKIYSEQKELHLFNNRFLSNSLYNSDETIKTFLRQQGEEHFPKETIVQEMRNAVKTAVEALPVESITPVRLKLAKKRAALPAELNVLLIKARGFPTEHISWIHEDYPDIEWRILQKEIAQRERQLESEKKRNISDMLLSVARQGADPSISSLGSLTPRN